MSNPVGSGQSIVVIGAGMVGVAAALWLLRDGHRVTIIDAKGPAEGTSYGNAGILASSSIVPVPVPGLLAKAPGMLFNPMGPLFLKWGYFPRLLPWLSRYLSHGRLSEVERISAALVPMIGDSVEQHRAVAGGTPAERFIQDVDYTYAYPDRAAYEKDGLAWRIRREHGFEPVEVEGEAVREVEPALGPATRFLAQAPGHAWIRDPGAYVRALCDHACAQGAELRIDTVTDFRIEGGEIRGIVTEQGTFECDQAVIATGAWSSDLCRKLGINAGLESERGYHVELENVEGGPSIPVALSAYKFVVTPMEGRLRLAGLVEFGGLEAGPSEGPFRLLLGQVKQAFPDLRWSGERRWLGHRPATIDSLPLLGPVEGVRGVHLAFGHQHVGLTAGAKAGRIISDLIAGRRPNFDMAPYRPERFG